MDEYINRQTVKDELLSWAVCINHPEHLMREDVIYILDSVPAVDVTTVRHGRWEQCFEDWRKQIEGDKCSACGFEHYGSGIRYYHYCPNCGAKMDGAKNG